METPTSAASEPAADSKISPVSADKTIPAKDDARTPIHAAEATTEDPAEDEAEVVRPPITELVHLPLLFRDKPVFGLDVGANAMRIVQTSQRGDKIQAVAVGSASFDDNLIDHGVIRYPSGLAKEYHSLLASHLNGKMTAKRAVISLPAAHTFVRSVKLPLLAKAELDEAVKLEAERYISVPVDDLYMDYHVVRVTQEQLNIFMVAAPREIIESYLTFASAAGFEVVSIEPSVTATGRLLAHDPTIQGVTMILDFGTAGTDISIYDESIVMSGTVGVGHQTLSQALQHADDSTLIKSQALLDKHGMGKGPQQAAVQKALEPVLSQLITEIRRISRYYQEHYGADKPIQQVALLGSGSSLRGLDAYMHEALGLTVVVYDPWQRLAAGSIEPPIGTSHPDFAAVCGLSLLNPKQVFAS